MIADAIATLFLISIVGFMVAMLLILLLVTIWLVR